MSSGASHAGVPQNDMGVLISWRHSREAPKSEIFTTEFTAIRMLWRQTERNGMHMQLELRLDIRIAMGMGIGMRRLTSSFAARTIQLRETLSQKIMNSLTGERRVESGDWRAALHPASGITYEATPETAVSVSECAH